jgi:NADH-quinone oxidoreductase subunit A
VIFRDLGWFGLAEMGVFVGILTVGLAYVWRVGALAWE